MADHQLVELTINLLANNWETDNFPGSYDAEKPYLIDRDDSIIYEITSTGTAVVGDAEVGKTQLERSVSHDLTENNAIGVSSSPDRAQSPMGSSFDYDIEDGVGLRVEGLHDAEFGYIANATAFKALYKEARRAVLVERVWPHRNLDGDVHYHSLETRNESNLSSNERDYFRYDFDVIYSGREELP